MWEVVSDKFAKQSNFVHNLNVQCYSTCRKNEQYLSAERTWLEELTESLVIHVYETKMDLKDLIAYTDTALETFEEWFKPIATIFVELSLPCMPSYASPNVTSHQELLDQITDIEAKLMVLSQTRAVPDPNLRHEVLALLLLVETHMK